MINQNYRVYITDLGAYNAGRLRGEWFELGVMDNDELEAKIKDMLKYGEEWAIHDYELPFKIEEYESIFKLNSFIEELDRLSEYEQVLALWLVSDYQESYEDAIDRARSGDYYIREADSLEEVAEEEIEELYNIPKGLEYYIDYSRYADDMAQDWCKFELNDKNYFIRG